MELAKRGVADTELESAVRAIEACRGNDASAVKAVVGSFDERACYLGFTVALHLCHDDVALAFLDGLGQDGLDDALRFACLGNKVPTGVVRHLIERGELFRTPLVRFRSSNRFV